MQIVQNLINNIIGFLGNDKGTMKIYTFVFFISTLILSGVLALITAILSQYISEMLIFMFYNLINIILWSLYNTYNSSYVRIHMNDKWYYRTLSLVSTPVFLISTLII